MRSIVWRFLLSLLFLFPLGLLAQSSLYFPPTDSDEWVKKDLNSLGWNNQELARFLEWLPSQGTRSFIILKDGEIVVEEYWGAKLTGLGDMDEDALWYWASAGKTLTSSLLGIAEKKKLLKVKHCTSKYLGEGWSSLPSKREKEIKISHQLTMTTGLDERIETPDNTEPENLKFFSLAGQRWAYHNAPYTLLTEVLSEASGQSLVEFFRSSLGDKIGMTGTWQNVGESKVFYSNARSMARFGLFLLNHGVWDGEELIRPKYFESMVSSGSSDNPSYGYLTWLNSAEGFKVPGIQRKFPGKPVESASEDMFMALGRNGQTLLVVPSENLVIVRMGTFSNEILFPKAFVNQLWDRMNKVIN
ncbi:serine hydrolase domain-containing protein [Algoriphagus sediminis]|uniref:Serine hydrolase n=1 Tax=Algoriphagus sediminis TaxID=3057113 RepID=A0ABT7Y7Q1_9BACT|nr:serine hydrolase [Algoriphagus sediminis]MDN3202549.1 serine hydrolase [Algoriphagus sediminis]